jgi:hypothetical protein
LSHKPVDIACNALPGVGVYSGEDHCRSLIYANEGTNTDTDTDKDTDTDVGTDNVSSNSHTIS